MKTAERLAEEARLVGLAARAQESLRAAPRPAPPAGLCCKRCKHKLVSVKLPSGKWTQVRECQRAVPAGGAPVVLPEPDVDLVKLVRAVLALPVRR